ncbi:MAG UNVERIFIED_CONTAM: hypothetical protein LVR29_01470 [Microcystis novacekii LVE1205-3]|jgi:hypothetical protein
MLNVQVATSFLMLLLYLDTAAIIYNYNPTTMPWISDETRNKIKIPQIGTIHEVNPKVAEGANRELFDYHITPNPTLVTNNPIVFKTGRLIPDYQNNYSLPSIPTIGSFGFATPDKGFEKLVLAVQEEFDEAITSVTYSFTAISHLLMKKL